MARCPRLVGHTALEKAVAVGPGGAAVGDARVAGLAALPADGQFRSRKSSGGPWGQWLAYMLQRAWQPAGSGRAAAPRLAV